MAALAHEVDNCPVLLSALQVCKVEVSEFTTAQTAAQQDGKNARSRLPFSASCSGACNS
jgi:hypothetical protein